MLTFDQMYLNDYWDAYKSSTNIFLIKINHESYI